MGARGFPEVNKSVHLTKSGAMGLKIDIGIKNSPRDIDN